MQKQTKNIITRKWIQKELHFYNTAGLRSALVTCIGLSIFLIPLALGSVYAVLSSFENGPFKFVFCFVSGAIMSSPVWVLLFCICNLVLERKAIKNGSFEITVGRLTHKEERLVRYGKNSRLEERLHFNGFHSVEVGHTAFQLATEGDDYYIIHYSKKKQIELVYSTKTYEYK